MERARLVELLAGNKGVFVEKELEQPAQVGLAGVVTAALPVANGLFRHPDMQRHFFLGQRGLLTQGQQALGEGTVPRFVTMMVAHGSPPNMHALSSDG